MKFLIVIFMLSSCSFMGQKYSKKTWIKNIFWTKPVVKNKRFVSSVTKLMIGKIYKIAIPNDILFKSEKGKLKKCKPVFGARIELLGFQGDQALLDYTSLMDIPNEEFCKDGHVFMSKFFLKQNANLFYATQLKFLSLEGDITSIIKKNFSTSKLTVKDIDGKKNIIKIGDFVKSNSQKILPLAVKGFITLKSKELNFMKGYINPRSSLQVGTFCSPNNLNLKIVGFSSSKSELHKNIFVKVTNEKTSNVFKLIGKWFSENNHDSCPVDTHFFISPEELLLGSAPPTKTNQPKNQDNQDDQESEKNYY
ncbi:MAG: hypothetical protein HAW60_05835 [Bdellovibrionales bacterium]|nr:hypothetical protein [Bdellovibrionales bacterium]